MAKSFFANVKSVLSGDTLVLASQNNPNAERTFSLAFVDAPRLRREGDEPFAFQSRDYLRSLTVGKPIQCTILYTVPSSGREYGYAQLKDGTQLPDELVKSGWLKVREDAGRKEESEDTLERLDSLRSLESQAKGEGKGLWAATGGVIEIQNDIGSVDFNQWKGKTVDGLVERVLSGDRCLVRLKLSDKSHLQAMTLIAGIRTPTTERVNQSTGQTQAAEEFGNEARQFVEQRLLQRDIKVELVGISPQGQLIASLVHPRGSIAEFLLADGLARCNDFHSTLLGSKMAALRAAEKKAQAGKLRLHKDHVAKATGGGTSDMIVSKVMSADTIFVRTKTGDDEKRISLSSVRGPRAGEPSEAPFRDEAKEYLRKKLIGKHVKISVDGSKPATDDFEARDVATVTEKGKNINLALVQDGWCSVIRHRKDDTDRAPNYDELLAAQEEAKEQKKGIWSGKASKARTYADASESVQKAKLQISTLSRQKKVPGIVDFCKAGSRFTILIPRESVKITMVLAGVRAPRAPRSAGEKGEPFGQEALDLANRRCNQRDCEIDVYDIDKVGGFIGDLYINRESFAKVLVEEGLAQVHQYSAEKAGNATELFAAEQKAKEGRKGLWHDWDPSQDENGDEDAAPTETPAQTEATDKRASDYREVVVTNIDSNGKFKIQEIGKGTSALEIMMNEFKKFHLDSKNNKALANPPKAGEYVAAKFSADGQWYRGRIRSNDRNAKVAEVIYIDYGNSEQIPWSALRPLDQPQFTVQKLKGQAIDAVLSFIQLPTSADYFQDAIDFLAEATDGRTLVASFDFVDPKEGLSYITLFDEKASGSFVDSINKDVVASGYAMVPKKLKAWERGRASEEVLKKLREVEAEAKQNRSGMWQYGDITED
ncbi:tudor domain-containing protein [Xylaria bambusicola]|uniref:tudor domain-containing protein n=1 Tax=Xylaria bambusicola TaxID=326684 RepID=UPI002008928C|nr:tudor domain-containing protein [Xylaria bambusicola]KAI0509595.1 tudor domain-containing protein [Xylaria bambusicola]